MKDIDIGTVWKILLALGAGTGAVYMLRWFWWRINAWSEIVAMVASLVYFLVFRSLFPGWREEELMLFVATVTIVTWLIATFVTPPDDERKLVAFYRKVRPGGGGWAPIARLAPEVQSDQHLGLSILAALAGASVVYFTLPAIGYFLFGQMFMGLACLAGALLCACLVWGLMRRIGWENVL